MKKLLEWKNSPYRKPLILKGVRQVGKTWILREFGRRYYENIAYFNFEENEEYKQFFETTKDADRILQNLMLASGQKIEAEKTLIIFDEVQDCSKVINSMKYFCENAPQYHIACAGSLLGIALAKPSSFPVGKVNFMHIDPMTFSEFLLANGDENLAKYMEQVDTIEPIPDAFFNPLYEKLKMYYVTGGMPEPVKMWTEARDVNSMQETLSDIIQVTYFKLTHGKRVFRMAPFHHHLEMGGWTGRKWKEKEIFWLFTGISTVMAVISFIGIMHRY